ncbi:BRO family protein [Roseovarius tolerans]|uniref:BRO-N domain-containing protein n=1 Tax=Roseovarius tolerans TaxID=74031 RepID=UPI00111332B9
MCHLTVTLFCRKVPRIFDFNSNNIRVIDIDGPPWFPAKDVCDILGITNTSDGSYSIYLDVSNSTNPARRPAQQSLKFEILAKS